MKKETFTGQGETFAELLELIRTAVWRPISTMARGNYHYFITLTNDLSWYG